MKGVACLIQDITQLKQVERELRESKQRLELALEAGAIGLWDWNLKTGRAIGGEWTTRLRQNVGYETEPWPDVRSWKRSVHPDDWDKVSEALNGHLSGRLPFFEAQLRMRSMSDEWKWYQSRGKVVEYDKEGKPLRISGTTADVTERMQAEEKLRKNEEKYRHLVENAYDIVHSTDRNGCVTFVNPACLLHIGYSPDELIGRNYLEFIPEECREHISGFYGRQVVNKVPNTSYDFPFIAKNGEIRWFIQNTQLLMKKDCVVGFQAIARDITESKLAEEALRNSVSFFIQHLSQQLTEFLLSMVKMGLRPLIQDFWIFGKIPQDIESHDDDRVLVFVLDQLVNLKPFSRK